MSYNSRLFTTPKLRKVVEITDAISDHCTAIADALASLEDGELSHDEREEARDEAWAEIGDLLVSADELRALRDSIGSA